MDEEYILRLKKEAVVLRQLCLLLNKPGPTKVKKNISKQQKNTDLQQPSLEKKLTTPKDAQDGITDNLADLKLVDEILEKAQKVLSGQIDGLEPKKQKVRTAAEVTGKKTTLQGVRQRPSTGPPLKGVTVRPKTQKVSHSRPSRATSSIISKPQTAASKLSASREAEKTVSHDLPNNVNVAVAGVSLLNKASAHETTSEPHASRMACLEELQPFEHNFTSPRVNNEAFEKLTALQKRNQRKIEQFNKLNKDNAIHSMDFVNQLEESFSTDVSLEELIKAAEDVVTDKAWFSAHKSDLSGLLYGMDRAKRFSAEFLQSMEILGIFTESLNDIERSETYCKDLQLVASRMIEIELLQVTAEVNRQILQLAESIISDPTTTKSDKVRVYRLAHGHICGQGRAFPSIVQDDIGEEVEKST